jgi:hypothetical protein
MDSLKLIALDADDLKVISAHMQDAVLRVSEMAYVPREKRFAMVVNRFNWAKAAKFGEASKVSKDALERRRTALRFERVTAAQVQGIDLKDKRHALALLAISFDPAQNGSDEAGPDGHVTLTFSGGASIRLTVECVEVELQDQDAAWATKHPPAHKDPGGGNSRDRSN